MVGASVYGVGEVGFIFMCICPCPWLPRLSMLWLRPWTDMGWSRNCVRPVHGAEAVVGHAHAGTGRVGRRHVRASVFLAWEAVQDGRGGFDGGVHAAHVVEFVNGGFVGVHAKAALFLHDAACVATAAG